LSRVGQPEHSWQETEPLDLTGSMEETVDEKLTLAEKVCRFTWVVLSFINGLIV
jgi:hypothetical protein